MSAIVAAKTACARSKLLQRFLAALRQGQWNHGNAFVQQLHGLLGTRLAADGALFGLAIVHAAGFIGKAFAHVLGLLRDLARPLQPGGLHGLQLLTRLGRHGR